MQIADGIIIIGLHSQRPRSGKSTVARAIADARQGRVFSIADGIRDVARTIGFQSAADAQGDAKDVPLPDLGGLTPRQVLILIGENRTARHGREYWLRRCLLRIDREMVRMPWQVVAVIDDVRRAEEGQGLVDAGATVCTIERDGVPDVVDINGWTSGRSYTFRNDGTPEECAARIWARARRDMVSS